LQNKVKEKTKMKTIIATSKELSKKEKYLLTSSNATSSIKGFEGQVIEVDAWCKFTDLADDGSETTILSFITKDGESIATNSKVVMKAFDEIVEAFEDELPPIEIITGTSKNGRKYFNLKVK
jgi:hypothetical protein